MTAGRGCDELSATPDSKAPTSLDCADEHALIARTRPPLVEGCRKRDQRRPYEDADGVRSGQNRHGDERDGIDSRRAEDDRAGHRTLPRREHHAAHVAVTGRRAMRSVTIAAPMPRPRAAIPVRPADAQAIGGDCRNNATPPPNRTANRSSEIAASRWATRECSAGHRAPHEARVARCLHALGAAGSRGTSQAQRKAERHGHRDVGCGPGRTTYSAPPMTGPRMVADCTSPARRE